MFKPKPQATVATTPTILAAMRIQQSSYGIPIPIVLGTQRVSGFILDDQDFKAIAHTTQQSSGGKGGHQNSGTGATTTYTYQAAVVVGLCEGTINGLFGVWDTKGKLLLTSVTESFIVPGGGGTVGVSQNGSNYRQHIGVTRGDAYSSVVTDYGSPGARTISGTQATPMTLTGGAPGAGQYQHNGTGGYTFAAADAGKLVAITYVFQVPDSSTTGNPATQLSLTLFPGTRPQTAWSYMTTAHPNNAIARSGLAYLANAAMDLGSQGSLPNYSYEISGLNVFGGNVIDCNPADMVNAIVTNQFWGCQIDSSFLGSLTAFSNYCLASGTFLSLVIDNQDSAASWLQKILDCCNTAAVWSNGQLNFIPYCDSTLIGNGATFSPSTTPIYDLTRDDFDEGDEPIQIDRESAADAFNCVQVEWLNRANAYNPEIVEAKDDASIFMNGLRMASVESDHCITTAAVAQMAVDFKLKRNVHIRKKYRFRLSWKYCLLEPMDLVTLTDNELGLNKEPVRIVSIEEDEEGKLSMIAEEFPWGTATPTQFPKQISTSTAPQFDIDPGNAATPIAFEAPPSLSKSGQHELWLGVCGQPVTNLLPASEQFNLWTLETGVSVSANSATDPLGGATADTISTGATANVGVTKLAVDINGNAINASNGTPYTLHVALKSATPVRVTLLVNRVGGLDAESVTFDIAPSYQGEGGRYKFTHSTTWTGTTQVQVAIRITTISSSVVAWGAQLEVGQARSQYVPTTTVAVSQPNANWGGADILVSYDNVTFTKLANPIVGPARMGVIAATQASGTDPDATNGISVDLNQSGGVLSSTTQSDADTFRTLCYVDGEFQSYKDVNLTATGKYVVGQVQGGGAIYLRRGLFTSKIAAHSAGKQFLRLDDAVYKFVYDPAMIGKTIFLKFTSFNRNGLREQSPASVPVYSFTLLGVYNQFSSLGVNLLANPSFELNVIGTPLATPLAVGAKVSDGFTYLGFEGGFIDGSANFAVTLDNIGGGFVHSGSLNLKISLKPGITVPNNASFQQACVVTDKIAVTAGQRYSFGAYLRTDQNASLPANVTTVAALRPLFYDLQGNFIAEDSLATSIDQVSVAIGTYVAAGNFITIPATFSGTPVGFMALMCSSWILNTTGAGFSTGASLYWDVRFDDLWLVLQNSLGDDSSGKQGSNTNAYTGALSYTSTTTSITWGWNFIASRTDLHLVRQNYNASQAVTGLGVGTSYNFYHFIDEFFHAVNAVATGGIGTPSWAHTGTNVAWTAEQTRSDHFPLTSGPAAGATTNSGTGGGSTGGGIGGSCLRSDVLCETRELGVIKHADLVVGMHVRCPIDEDTPDGWARVEYVKHANHTEWVHSIFTCDDWLPTTAGHAFTLSDGTMKRAAQLSLEDEIPCATGICWLSGHFHRSYTAQKTQITIASKRHVYYAGMKKPQISQHNFQPNT